MSDSPAAVPAFVQSILEVTAPITQTLEHMMRAPGEPDIHEVVMAIKRLLEDVLAPLEDDVDLEAATTTARALSTIREDDPPGSRLPCPTMMRIANAQVWVADQDEALAFYTEKLGMEVRADVTMAELGNFRWLAVSPQGQEDVSIVLMAIPGPPVFDDETAQTIRELMSKGAAGTVFLTTDDVRGDYERLAALGVEFVDLPEERPYGIDCGFRDPSGNHFRLTQITDF